MGDQLKSAAATVADQLLEVDEEEAEKYGVTDADHDDGDGAGADSMGSTLASGLSANLAQWGGHIKSAAATVADQLLEVDEHGT